MSIRPYTIKLLLDRLETPSSTDSLLTTLLFPACGYLICEIGMQAAFRFYDYIRMFVYPRMQAEIIQSCMSYIQGHSHQFFLSHLSGSIASQIRDLSLGVKELLQIAINRFFSHILGFFVACVTMVLIHPCLAIIVTVWAVFFLFATWILSKRSFSVAKETASARIQTAGVLTDIVTNMATVRLFSSQEYERSLIQDQTSHQLVHDQCLEWSNLKSRAIQGSSVIVLFAALLSYLIYARIHGRVTIGDFSLILTLGVSLSQAIQNLSQDLVTFTELQGKCCQALQLIQMPHEQSDRKGAKPLDVSGGEIAFNHVCFAYENTNPLFNDLTLAIHPKEKVGIVGFSGAGKSTFAHLLVRFYSPSSGTISIDGQGIHEVTQESLYKIIALIPQETTLFHRSIRENILYGCTNVSEEELISACQKAHAFEFIVRLPEKFDTVVGERGTRLSGGQRQRIAIARAFVKNAPILILDEATSALDSVSERMIQESLKVLMQDKTVLIIAHRLSTLQFVDRIFVFQQGIIAEEGTHDALIARKGIYANLWNLQSNPQPQKT